MTICSKINDKIKSAIIQKEPLSFGKLGGIEASHIYQYLSRGRPSLVRGSTLFVNAGIYVSNESELKQWCDYYIQAIKSLDYVVEWCPEQGDKAVIKTVWDGKEIGNDFSDIEPYKHAEQGWHYALSDKTLLCVSPFSDTIKQQIPYYGKIWKGASIGDVVTVRSPYSEALTDEKPIPWLDKYNKMTDEIAKLDFDFASVGCGGFSLLICDFIKQQMGKPCVHLGGSNQLLFGIQGGRFDWHGAPGGKAYGYGEEYWTRPLDHEIPIKYKLVEGGCYW